jgi:RES domain-containing protein
MSPRLLGEPMRVYRIGDPKGRYPIFSGKGASRHEGRWHERGQDIMYTSSNYSTAMLEKLVHFNGVLPKGQHFIEITIPARTSYEVVTKDSLPGWEQMDGAVARRFGAVWARQERSAILIVPSVVAREETNVLINPRHGEAKRIKAGLEKPIWWDERLFAAT